MPDWPFPTDSRYFRYISDKVAFAANRVCKYRWVGYLGVGQTTVEWVVWR
jgi:hypothetical protein